MKAIKFLEEKNRMTKGCGCEEIGCKDCPLFPKEFVKHPDNWGVRNCADYIVRNPEKAVSIVKKWSKENPVKTYKRVFFKKFPNAPYVANFYGAPTVSKNAIVKREKGTPCACLADVFGAEKASRGCCEVKTPHCKLCWEQEYTE